MLFVVSRTELRRAAHLLLAALGITLFGLHARAADRAPRPLWSFHAGAPLSGPPALGADGSFAIGTVDGYVHALRPDGVFRYSYTVDGRVVFSPVVLGDGLVLAASNRNRLYAIRPDGSLAWESTVAGGVLSPLAVDSQERVWLRTGSGTAIAMSRRGGVVGFSKIGRAISLGPAALARSGVVVGSPAGELRLIGDYGRFRKASVDPPLSWLRPRAPGFLALASRALTQYGAELEAIWTRSDVDELLCTTPLVTREAQELRWIADDGGVVARVAVSGAVTGPSACTQSSVFALDARGDLAQFRKVGGVLSIDSPGGNPIALDASQPGRLVVAYRDGRITALKAVP
jgi:outer membrane protein assembly factor BamB